MAQTKEVKDAAVKESKETKESKAASPTSPTKEKPAEPAPETNEGGEESAKETTAKTPKERKRRSRNKKKDSGEAKDKENANGNSEKAEEKTEQEPAEEDHTIKVFAGNLPFTTTEEQLKEFFAPAGEVVDAVIITRGSRSLGYGFVSFNTQEEADKAVSELDKKEIETRQLNVELAKPKEASERKGRGVGGATRGGMRGRYRGYRGGRGRGYYRGGRGRYRGGRGGVAAAPGNEETTEKRVDDENNEEVVEEQQQVSEGEEGTRGGRGRGRGRGRGYGRARRRFPRGGRGGSRLTFNENGEPEGEPSDTMLFVANLPFKVTDADLKAIFHDYKVVSAHVVRLRSGRSKGFGFVEVESKEEQQRVLTELKNVAVDERELVIKVAMASQVPHNNVEGEGEGEKVEEVVEASS
ncbi:hypothetical protein HK102_005365 [Quaeritorhiza haematococci]|nr:hypothetical protein HK102_005365 [Quaeritorhiza haematococci]